MNYTTAPLGIINIIGIAVRTTNENNQSQKDIQQLWERFLGQNIMAQIPNKENNEVYNIYTDYESDVNGPYTTLLGCKVKSLDTIPDGFVGKIIPAANYRLYEYSGKLPDCVMQTWQHIWQSDVERAYIADFDIYDMQSPNPDTHKVRTYLSVK